MSRRKYSYEDFLADREEMPTYDESIFYPEIKRREFGISDEEMNSIVEYFRWHLNQQNRRMDCQRIIALLKLRVEYLIQEKKSELARDVEALKLFSK
jgi:hypothetical protein